MNMLLKPLIGLVAGVVFGVGLVISEMINPAKVLGFLNIFGAWDPSLIFVMGGGLVVFAIGYWLLMRGRSHSFLGEVIKWPEVGQIDLPLVLGAVLFGLGWGLVGLCPGPAVAATLVAGADILIFLVAMAVGMIAHSIFDASRK